MDGAAVNVAGVGLYGMVEGKLHGPYGLGARLTGLSWWLGML